MKKTYYFLTLFFVTCTATLLAQTEQDPWQITFGINAVDVYPTGQSPYGDLFEDFFNVQDHWNAIPMISYIDVRRHAWRGFSLVVRLGYNRIKHYGPIEKDANHLFANTDAVIKYNVNTLLNWNRLAPFVEFGGGYSVFNITGEGSFNLGTGIDYLLGDSKKAVLSLGTTNKGMGHLRGAKHFQHTLGIGFRFGSTDTDGDGIPDDEDACPEVPGLERFQGCPDSDGDGVADCEDACLDTAGSELHNGCPDTDGDGIADPDDRCPQQAGTAALQGCPDQDGDGIADAQDDCPTVAGTVALNGCPDTDGDGITDLDDNCPDVAGTPANNGCPEMGDQEKDIINSLGQIIYFDFNSYSIIPKSIDTLEEIYEILKNYPNATIVVEGHTDAKGSTDFNQALSELRAEVELNYLVRRGLNRSQFTYIGKGESEPVATNDTPEGRKANRRVVFKIN